MKAIEVKNAHFQYNKTKVIYEGLNFSLNRHERIFLSGPSGVGKSSFLYWLNDCVPQHILAEASGEYLLFEQPINSYTHAQKIQTINLVFQQPHWQFVGLYVMDELAFALENIQTPASIIKSKIMELLTAFDCIYLKDKKIAECSIGEQQLIALGSTMLLQPKILCLDEALSALSFEKKKQIIPIIEQQIETLLVVDHQHDSLWNISKRFTL